MRAYIINLDSAKDRWESVAREFSGTKFELRRISGVDGNTLQITPDDYSATLYRWFHGRPTNPRHIGCYLSHVRAMKAFLATDDSHALICEDDLLLRADFEKVIEFALRYTFSWNILRLTGLGKGQPVKIVKLGNKYSLCVNFGRLKGTGAYVLDRKAASAWADGLLPMRLPIDHALDREWFFGLRAVDVLPFPATQTESGFRSSIHVGESLKSHAAQRWLTTYPYQALNELSRWLFRAAAYVRIKSEVRSILKG